MRGLALAFALASLPALADPSPDAPVRRTIRAGEVAPADGCFLDNPACVATGAELAQLRAENADLKAHAAELPTAVLLITFAAGVLAGGAAVYVVTR